MSAQSLTQQINQIGIDADDLIIFLRESLEDARQFHDVRGALLTPEDKILQEMRLTNIEALLVHLERERI